MHPLGARERKERDWTTTPKVEPLKKAREGGCALEESQATSTRPSSEFVLKFMVLRAGIHQLLHKSEALTLLFKAP